MAPPPPSPNRNSNDDSAGCFSAIIHRLLCRNGVPTHPTSSSELNHPTSAPPRHSTNKTSPHPPVLLSDDVSSSVDEKPGIVARLMGLETLPDFTTRRLRPVVDPSTVPRSRSVNFMDYLGTVVEHQHHHRRVRTSVSFREVVVPRQQKKQEEEEDLLVLYLDELAVAAAESSSSCLGRVPNSSGSISNYHKGSSRTRNAGGKELKKLEKKKKLDSKLYREEDENKKVVLENKELQVIRNSRSGKSSSSSSIIRVKDGAAGANREAEREYSKKKKKDDNGKRRGGAGKLIHHHKEFVAESNFFCITNKTSRRISAPNNSSNKKQVVAKRSLEEDTKSYVRNLSSTSWRHDCSSPAKPETFPECVNERTGKLDTPEKHNYSAAAALDHVCKLTEEDIINKYDAFGTKEDKALSSEYEEICVLIEQRILNIIIQHLVADLLPLH